MRKLIILLIAFIAAATFITAYERTEVREGDLLHQTVPAEAGAAY